MIVRSAQAPLPFSWRSFQKLPHIMGDECALLSPAFGHQVECTISPLVVFSVLDHYMRRSEGQERVIGTLLGANNDGHLEITNCFPVPHTEGETVSRGFFFSAPALLSHALQVGIDMDFHKTMFGLHRQGTRARGGGKVGVFHPPSKQPTMPKSSWGGTRRAT